MRRCLAVLLVLFGLLIAPVASGAQGTPSCHFLLGFAALHDLIPDHVGTCLDDEQHNPENGDALQHTTGGLLVWRKIDNWTAFTDGYNSWVNGPFGLQQRLNTQRFSWEANPTGLPLADAPKDLATPPIGTVEPVFQPVLVALRARTRVPLVLPTFVARIDGDPPLFAHIEAATTAAYSIILGFTPDCGGGTACRHGTIAGAMADAGAIALDGTPVDLLQGRIGFFVPSTCGANCSDATLSWEQGGARYRVGLKADDLATLIRMANSAIVNGVL